MPLSVPGPHSCMATVVNYYFGFLVFYSYTDFIERQTLLARRQGVPVSRRRWDIRLIDRVEIHHRVYRRVTVFSSRLHRRESWANRLRGMHTRAIVDYRRPGHREHHTECFELIDGRVTFPQHTGRMALPYSSHTLAEYIDLCYGPRAAVFYLAIYIYCQ